MYKLTRQGGGPVLMPDSALPWESEGVFNPGVAKIGDEVIMLYRAVGERESYISRFGLAKSRDGIHFKRVSDKPVFEPREAFDTWAVEDPRITKIGDVFYVTYVAVPDRILKDGLPIKRELPLEASTALLQTTDFLSYKNLGIISSPNSDNKDVVLFPRMIHGRYYMLHRPHRWSKEYAKRSYARGVDEEMPFYLEDLPEIPGIWIASSTDLKHWTNNHIVFAPSHPHDAKIGSGLPPLETKDGWLLIYHHVKKEKGSKRFIYSARAALLDLEDPTHCIARLHEDILTPEMPYEMEHGMNVVFPTGGFISGDTLSVYYGASDYCIGLATGSLAELLTELKKNPVEKSSN
jgi:beta-1,2-mannobiose phosphorylase / 1,2-beta-oligomannan phosphorylase